MRALTTAVLAGTAGLLLSACASFEGRAARDLSAEEMQVLGATRARLTAGRTDVSRSLDDLADNVGFALDKKHGLNSNIARAQLLEAMRSPWTQPGSTATQREVALYHLFALAEAEQAALSARIAAREARIALIRSAYSRLIAAMSGLIAAQEQLLAHLDQPASTQIGLVMQQMLAESQAFRDALDTGDNPRLQRLAATVLEREQAIAAVEVRIVELLESLERE